MSKKEKKVVYYHDELNDEFSTAQIETKYIGENYKYLHKTIFGSIFHAFVYRGIAIPLAFIYLKCKFHHKIIGKEKLKKHKKESYFIYGNHTQIIGDALIPTFVSLNKGTYVIVHPNNVSMKFLGKVTPYLGAIPLPDDLKATRNFIKCLEKRMQQKKAICIYPEAHLWPYYTKIRPFLDKSFHYPIKYNKPVYCFTNTYHKRKHSDKVNIITYVDGPFYADPDLDMEENKIKLRNEVYEAMCNRAKTSDYEVVEYRKAKDD